MIVLVFLSGCSHQNYVQKADFRKDAGYLFEWLKLSHEFKYISSDQAVYQLMLTHADLLPTESYRFRVRQSGKASIIYTYVERGGKKYKREKLRLSSEQTKLVLTEIEKLNFQSLPNKFPESTDYPNGMSEICLHGYIIYMEGVNKGGEYHSTEHSCVHYELNGVWNILADHFDGYYRLQTPPPFTK